MYVSTWNFYVYFLCSKQLGESTNYQIDTVPIETFLCVIL